MKKLLTALVVLGICTGIVWAWSDSFTVTVTPLGERGVIIDSSTYDFGNMGTGESAISTDSIPVKSTGTVSPLEYTIQGQNATTWVLGPDGKVTPDTNDEIVLQALFQDTATAPAAGDFGAADTVTTAVQDVGDAAGEFEGTADMDDLGLLVTKHLYLRLSTPPTTSTESTQTFMIIINAEAAD